ncbi:MULTISPECIES: hypothetical protein [unclassified Nostoc]|uniref:hypothetical protein n=1 Tax=unclassified Nostoc TaxID=2593658 RepID=UPI0025DE790E|nr:MULTISPECIES: hypothetical protein [unclassified Nostoc]
MINYKKVNAGKALKEMTDGRNLKINTRRLSYFSTKKRITTSQLFLNPNAEYLFSLLNCPPNIMELRFFMNRVISGLRNIRISQILVVFLVGFMFLLGQAFSYVNVAQAETVKTPEGIYYKGTPNESEIRNDTQAKNTQNPLKSAANNLREKLNLDEKTPRATKEFFDPAKNKATDKEGYYQNPSSKQLRDRS